MTKFVCETLGTLCVLLSKYIFNVYFDFIQFRNSIILKKKKKNEKIEREIKQYESIRDFKIQLLTILGSL